MKTFGGTVHDVIDLRRSKRIVERPPLAGAFGFDDRLIVGALLGIDVGVTVAVFGRQRYIDMHMVWLQVFGKCRMGGLWVLNDF